DVRRHPAPVGGAVRPRSARLGGACRGAGRPLYRVRLVTLHRRGARAPRRDVVTVKGGSLEVSMPEVRSALVNDQTRAIEDWAAYWSAPEMASLLPLFTDDVIYEDVPMGVMNRGAAELRAFVEMVFSRIPDVTF